MPERRRFELGIARHGKFDALRQMREHLEGRPALTGAEASSAQSLKLHDQTRDISRLLRSATQRSARHRSHRDDTARHKELSSVHEMQAHPSRSRQQQKTDRGNTHARRARKQPHPGPTTIHPGILPLLNAPASLPVLVAFITAAALHARASCIKSTTHSAGANTGSARM